MKNDSTSNSFNNNTLQRLKWSMSIHCFLLFLTTVCFVGVLLKHREDQKNLELLFTDFMATYGRNYGTSEERNHRSVIFLKNHQSRDKEERRTEYELRHLIPNQTIKVPEKVPIASFDIDSRPENFDLRNVTGVAPIKSQGACGSCWAFSTVAAIEILISMKTQNSVDLSEQELVDCDRGSFGCHGGWPQYAMSLVIAVGLCLEKDYQYKGYQARKCSMNFQNNRVFINGLVKLDKGEESIANWVYKNGSVTFSMKATRSLLSYRSGIFHPTPEECQDESAGNHIMTIIGYGVSSDFKQYWIVRNSWGVKWGENGYMKLARGVNSCGMANSVVAPILDL